MAEILAGLFIWAVVIAALRPLLTKWKADSIGVPYREMKELEAFERFRRKARRSPQPKQGGEFASTDNGPLMWLINNR